MRYKNTRIFDKLSASPFRISLRCFSYLDDETLKTVIKRRNIVSALPNSFAVWKANIKKDGAEIHRASIIEDEPPNNPPFHYIPWKLQFTFEIEFLARQ